MNAKTWTDNPHPLADSQAQARLVEVVRATPAHHRHALIEAMGAAIRSTLEDIPASGECTCGHLLVPHQPTPEADQDDGEDVEDQVAESYELDYSVGWQAQQAYRRNGQPAFATNTERNDQHTAAHILCPTCHRLWDIPPVWDKTYG